MLLAQISAGGVSAPEQLVLDTSLVEAARLMADDEREKLGAIDLTREEDSHWRRVVIEKPFGRDLDSARALNAELRAVLEENQIFRIDHYLGKETVQNMLALRFANGIFEPIWNRQFIDHVQITVAESLGFRTVAINLYRPEWDDFVIVPVLIDMLPAREPGDERRVFVVWVRRDGEWACVVHTESIGTGADKRPVIVVYEVHG